MSDLLPHFETFEKQLDIKLSEFLRQHQIAHEKFTEQQIAKCFKEALLTGDFVKCVTNSGAQGVYYVPYVEQEGLRSEIHKLLKFIYDRFVFACDKCGSVAQCANLNRSGAGVEEGRRCFLNDCEGKVRWRVKP